MDGRGGEGDKRGGREKMEGRMKKGKEGGGRERSRDQREKSRGGREGWGGRKVRKCDEV